MFDVVHKRAMNLVAEARLLYHKNQSPIANSDASSPAPSSLAPSSPVPSLDSPLPLWWDEVFEAADITKLQQRSTSFTSVKRRLSFSTLQSAASHTILAPNIISSEEDARSEHFLEGTVQVLPPTNIKDINLPCHRPAEECIVTITQENLVEDIPSKDHSVQVPTPVKRECSDDEETLEGITQVKLKSIYSQPVQHHALPSDTTNVFGDLHVPHDINITSASVGSEEHSPLSTLNSLDCSKSTLSVCNNSNKTSIYPSHLKIFSAKVALNAGRQHVNHKGKLRQARYVKTPCAEKCNRCESPRLTEVERICINKMFWNLNDHLKHWKFIKESLRISPPVKKFALKGSKGEKLSSRTYFFKIDGKERKVCKTMFKNTLCICDSWINNAISHCSDSGIRGDNRGKHKNRPQRKPKTSGLVS